MRRSLLLLLRRKKKIPAYKNVREVFDQGPHFKFSQVGLLTDPSTIINYFPRRAS